MNVSTMRKVDRWVGVPLCAVLTALRRCRDLLARLRGPAAAEVRRILLVKPAEQGASVLAHAALTRAVEKVGRENVFILVFEANRFILDVMGVIPAENVVTVPAGKGLVSLLVGGTRALWRLRRLRIDAAIDFEFFARSSAVLTYLSGARVRVGLHAHRGDGPWRGDLMTHRVGYNPHIHTSQTFQVLVQAMDAPPGDLPALDMDTPPAQGDVPPFVPSEEEVGRFRAVVVESAGADDFSPLVLLNANASDLLPLRRWADERYVELARRLTQASPTVRVAFTGAPDEAGHGAELARAVASERCFSLAGKTSMRELLVLYCLADVLVTNDSGPAHFAMLTPIQVVTLFGPETPDLFAARTPRNHVIWKAIPCSPCVSAYNNRLSACRNNVCMQRITVDEVFEKVRGLARV